MGWIVVWSYRYQLESPRPALRRHWRYRKQRKALDPLDSCEPAARARSSRAYGFGLRRPDLALSFLQGLHSTAALPFPWSRGPRRCSATRSRPCGCV